MCYLCLVELPYALNILVWIQEDVLYVFLSIGMGCRIGLYDVSCVWLIVEC
jgi:hypothetical protein